MALPNLRKLVMTINKELSIPEHVVRGQEYDLENYSKMFERRIYDTLS